MSRPKRWAAAATAAREALTAIRAKLEEVTALLEPLNGAMTDLRAVQEEYEEWQGNLPDSLQSSPVGEKLQGVMDLDLESYLDLDEERLNELSDLEAVLDECESTDLPRGFGKD